MPLPDEHRRELDEIGCVVLPGFCEPGVRERITSRIEELFEAEGESAGNEFKPEEGCRRLANLADKDPLFRRQMVREDLLEYVAEVLGPRFKLSSLNARSINAGCSRTQPLHADMGALPDERGYWVCNTLWMLDDFTAENGPLRFVAGTHQSDRLPGDVLADPLADHPEQQLLTGPAGTVVVMNAHLWHGGMPNLSDRPRRALHIFFARHDMPQQQYQKQLLRPETQAQLTPAERGLLALDDPLNDQVSQNPAVRSGFLK